MPTHPVLMFARTPPPITGMTLFSNEVLNVLRAHGAVEFVNWSVGDHRRSWMTRVKYIGRAFYSLLRLLVHKGARGERVYLMVNSESGLYSTAALASLAARRGFAVYLHHHVYNYIERHDAKMAWIERHLGPFGVHIVACPGMMRDYNSVYHSPHRFFVIHPSAVAIGLCVPRTKRPTPLRLGMLSNLSLAKGIDLTIATFVRLQRAGRPVTLTLAGPTLDRQAQQLVSNLMVDFPDSIRYLGPVYDSDKAQFFRDIDVFLFPTQRESWGIVIHEALAAGVPVVANDRGCTSWVIGDRAGSVVPRGSDFVEAAIAQIGRWLDQPDEYLSASQEAVQRADFLNTEGQRTLQEFAKHMFSPIGSTDGLLTPK